MYDLTAIEAINVEQLVTATDRLLLCPARSRPSRRTVDLSQAAQAAVARSTARIAATAAPYERTVFVRKAPRRGAELVGAAALFMGAWFGVVTACLLA